MGSGQLAVSICPLDCNHENILVGVHLASRKAQLPVIRQYPDVFSFLKLLSHTAEKKGMGVK